MRIKKGYSLFFMLAILVAHTLTLSLWLAEGEAVQKQTNFRIEDQKEKNVSFGNLNTKLARFTDSTKTVQPIFTTNLGLRLK